MQDMTRVRHRNRQTIRTSVTGKGILPSDIDRETPPHHHRPVPVPIAVASILLLVCLVATGIRPPETMDYDLYPSHRDVLLAASSSSSSSSESGVVGAADASSSSGAVRRGLPAVPAAEIPSPPPPTSKPPIKIAYAVSLIECTNKHKSGQSSVAGLQDASLVLRHSVHHNSVRNPSSGSKYDYEMYAIVHEKAQRCAPLLADAGFTVLVQPPPIAKQEIRGEWLRKNIHKEVCCGADEFVKLHAYTIDAPLVVHLDIDFVFRKPMDAVFDALLLLRGEGEDVAATGVEREDPSAPWPARPEAAIVRDYTSALGPGRPAGFQAGFWVLKPSRQHFENLLEIVREGNYTPGFQYDNGWGGRGYGGFVGAKAMQGLIAYYYDVHVPGTWIELNNCRFDAVQAIVTKKGKCLSGRESCEDCRATRLEDVYSFHYTACRKPWSCIAMGTNDPNNPHHRKYSIPEDIVHRNKCLESRRIWHQHRRDLEQQLYDLTGDETIRHAQTGNYTTEFFLGHCTEDQSKGYLRIGGTPETKKRIPELYESLAS